MKASSTFSLLLYQVNSYSQEICQEAVWFGMQTLIWGIVEDSNTSTYLLTRSIRIIRK